MFPFMRHAVRPEFGLVPRRTGPFGLLPAEADVLLNRLLGRWAIPEEWFPETPSWAVTELEKEVVYRIALPGFEVGEIELTIVGDEMTLRAEHRVPEEAPANREAPPYARVELTVTLPAGLEAERMEARFRNGLLEVHIPRVPAAVPRRVEVKT
jgi:HSP20 family molecular chaperone IbpA